MNRTIPEFHDWSDRYYWTEVFPNRYRKRTKTYITSQKDPSLPPLLVDGDVSFEFSSDKTKRVAVCNCCGHHYTKARARLFGNIDVGMELVYCCPECGGGFHRVYTTESRCDDEEVIL